MKKLTKKQLRKAATLFMYAQAASADDGESETSDESEIRGLSSDMACAALVRMGVEHPLALSSIHACIDYARTHL